MQRCAGCHPRRNLATHPPGRPRAPAGGGGMMPYKILNRTEDLEWDPPSLRFRIERHGGASLGSVYAEMQGWDVNIETGVANGWEARKRLIKKKQPPFRTGPLAAELADLVLKGKSDHRLQRSSKGRYRLTGAALPRASKQTTEGRRTRLVGDLAKILEPMGWRYGNGGWWSPPITGSEGEFHQE